MPGTPSRPTPARGNQMPLWVEEADKVATFGWEVFKPIFQRHYLDDEHYTVRRDRFLAALAPLVALCPPDATDETVDWEAVERVLTRSQAVGDDFKRYAEEVNRLSLAALPDGTP